MDLVYTYRAGSPAGNNELRYSIRSMVRHLYGLNKIFVVGDDPRLTRCIHIPCGDPHDANPARNIYEKILAACRRDDLSDDFIYSADDHYLLRDFIAEKFPYYFKGDLYEVIEKFSESHPYRAHLASTFLALRDRQLPTKFFNVHSPVVYNKHKFIELMPGYNWDQRKSFVIKSLYANSLMIEGIPIEHDKKFHWSTTKTAVHRQIKGLPFFSTNELSFNEAMISVMEELYPVPSEFE